MNNYDQEIERKYHPENFESSMDEYDTEEIEE
jgi:hypothetical protein